VVGHFLEEVRWQERSGKGSYGRNSGFTVSALTHRFCGTADLLRGPCATPLFCGLCGLREVTYFVCGFVRFRSGKSAFFDVVLGIGRKSVGGSCPVSQAAGFLGENLRFSRSPARQVLLLRNGRFARRAADGKKVRLFFAAVFGRRRACPLSTGRCGKSWKNKEISRSDDQAMEGSRCRNGLWRSWSSTGISAFF